MSVAIQIDNMVKSYDENTVIKGISFDVSKGEIFALLGTNGAGKTTTLECIEGLRKYDSGNIIVNGKMGVQLQSSSLPENVKPLEALNLFAKWNNTNYDDKLLTTFDIKDLQNKKYKELSTGQKRRLHLALALIGNPDIIFLDEPTAGLDVEGRVRLHDEIRKLKKLGKTIVMASHDMAEVESLCDRLAILKDGNIAFIGTSGQLTQRVGQQSKILIKTNKSLPAKAFKHCGYEGEQQGYLVFASDNICEALIEILEAAKTESIAIDDIKIERATLEQRFMDIANKEEQL